MCANKNGQIFVHQLIVKQFVEEGYKYSYKFLET